MYDKKMTILRSSDDEITLATLVCETAFPMSDGELLEAFKRGVTEWIETTEEGKEAWEASSEDFNIGDLESYLTISEELGLCLRDDGIIDAEVEIVSLCISASNAWTYDTILANM